MIATILVSILALMLGLLIHPYVCNVCRRMKEHDIFSNYGKYQLPTFEKSSSEKSSDELKIEE